MYDTQAYRDLPFADPESLECIDVLATAMQLMKSALSLLDSAGAPADIGAILDHSIQRLHDHIYAANDDTPLLS